MDFPKTAEDKILCVLDCIKEQYDISPKGEYSTSFGMGYGFRHQAGQVECSVEKIIGRCGIDFYELEKILARLGEAGLIEDFKIQQDYI